MMPTSVPLWAGFGPHRPGTAVTCRPPKLEVRDSGDSKTLFDRYPASMVRKGSSVRVRWRACPICRDFVSSRSLDHWSRGTKRVRPPAADPFPCGSLRGIRGGQNRRSRLCRGVRTNPPNAPLLRVSEAAELAGLSTRAIYARSSAVTSAPHGCARGCGSRAPRLTIGSSAARCGRPSRRRRRRRRCPSAASARCSRGARSGRRERRAHRA